MRPLIDIDELSHLLAVPKASLYKWRATNYGPAGFRVGKHLRWDPADIEAWIAEQKELARS